jgi:hypothetical protein
MLKRSLIPDNPSRPIRPACSIESAVNKRHQQKITKQLVIKYQAEIKMKASAARTRAA